MKIDESWYIRPPNIPERLSAGGVICRKINSTIEIALMTSGGGEWKLPKGGLEKGETLVDTAVRESEEEAGAVNLELICEIGVKEKLTYEKDFWDITHYFLFRTNSELKKPVAIEKHYESDWFDINNLPTIYWPEQKDLIEDNQAKIKNLI